MSARIRPARTDEGSALREIERLAGVRFREVGLPAVADDEPASIETLARYADHGRSWVAVDASDVPIGYALVDVVDGCAHIEQVSVRPDHQGSGVGRALIDHVRHWASDHDLPAVTLTTFTDVPWNAPLYRHLGFRVLDDNEIGPELRRLRDRETAHGLDPATRVCMRSDVCRLRERRLPRAPAAGADGTRAGSTGRAWNDEPVDADTPHAVGRLVVITGLPGSGKTTLATELCASVPACRMCPDDWMMAAGIDLWDEAARAQIEAFQLTLTLGLLRTGRNVVIEWGTWAREERDALRDAARAIGAPVELRYLSAEVDELWRRIVERDLEGRWASRPIGRHELDEWLEIFQPPTSAELATYDQPQRQST